MTTFDDVAVVQTTISISKKLYTEFKEKASKEGFSVNDAIGSLIFNYVNELYPNNN